MTPEEAKEKLKRFQVMPIDEQKMCAREIDEAFRSFWLSSPTEDEFADHMEGVLLTARMLHIALTARK